MPQPRGQPLVTGPVPGDHLHFEIRIDGEPVDPLQYLPGGRLFSGGSGDHGDESEPSPSPSPSPEVTPFESFFGLGER